MEKLTNMKEIKGFTASLHTHVRSIFDAHIDAKALCARIAELGGKGCAITDHGTLDSIEDYRRVFAEAGLKLVPGCELYISDAQFGNMHLVVLAANDRGYHKIIKMVTEANRKMQRTEENVPSLSREELFSLIGEQGDIICLSACVAGVVATPLLYNFRIMDKIAKLEKKLDQPDCTATKEDVEKFEAEVEQAKEELRNLKKLAKTAMKKKTSAVEKAESKNLPEAAKMREELEQELARVKKAAEDVPGKEEEVKKLKSQLSGMKAEYAKVLKANAKNAKTIEKIKELEEKKLSEEYAYKMAEETARAYRDAFGNDNFFLELQYHGMIEERICYAEIAQIAKEHGISVVATNDVHMLNNTEDDFLKRRILRSLRFKNWAEESDADRELYLKDDEELAKMLGMILDKDTVTEAVGNIAKIFDRCNVEFSTGKHYPVFDRNKNADEILDAEVAKGVKWRFPQGMDQEHEERLAYELGIIKKMGYSNYHLIVKDFLEYGRLLGYVPTDKIEEAPLSIEELKEYISANGWKVSGFTIGPGRGSAAGSLACYIFGITSLDPIKYGLLFERFLNPERVSMPDIDSDIANSIRAKVIRYVQAKYGEKAVCGIMTTDAIAPKKAIRTAAKYYGLSAYGKELTSIGNTLAKDVPSEPGTSFDTKTETGQTLYERMCEKFTSADEKEILRWAKVLEGSFTAYGAHAAGIVISDNEDISDYIPLRYNENLKMMTTQCDMVQVEDNGLLKFDLLGLRTHDVITGTIRRIYEKTGKVIDPLAIDLNDQEVYRNILATAQTKSVFQLESDGMRKALVNFGPDCFEDLILLVSIYRPGPLQYLDSVCDVKNGRTKAEYLCPELEPVLGKTYAAIIYQEQVMEIFQKLAGYTLGGADQVRRYMSKKKQDKLVAEKEAFVNGDASRNIKGCVANGIKKETAEELFEQMKEFAKYAFNKSHAAVYALVAYITAWLKYYYKNEFYVEALNNADPDKKLPGLLKEAMQTVKVTAPDINVSKVGFTTIGNTINFGLASIPGVSSQAKVIIEERERGGEFRSLSDFLNRMSTSRMNKTVVEHLIKAGAFDAFCTSRQAMLDFYAAEKDNAPEIPETEIAPGDESKKDRLKAEHELLKAYISASPLDCYPSAKTLMVKPISEITEYDLGAYGVVTNLVTRNRKSDGATMAFFDLEDRTGTIQVAVFASEYAALKEMIKEGNVLKIGGKVEKEVFLESDENGNEIESYSYKLIAKQCFIPEEKKKKAVLDVDSFVTFMLDVQDAFKKKYVKEDGLEFLIYDKKMKETRKMLYKVSDEVLKLRGAHVIY